MGIDILPYKTCSYNCIYCQLGATTTQTVERKKLTTPKDILSQIKTKIANDCQIDYLTFSGSGEPTLNAKLGLIINRVKKFTSIPVAVITNGSLLFVQGVQEDLLVSNVVMPTLCTTSQMIFEKIHRPYASLKIEMIINSLINFRKRYKGKIWLEVMLVKGLNETEAEIEKLNTVITQIMPDKIQLNTVTRPPNVKTATPISFDKLQEIKSFLGKSCEIIVDFDKARSKQQFNGEEKTILNLIKRRPVTLEEITRALGIHRNEALKYLDVLKKNFKIKIVKHADKKYFQIT